MDSYPINWYPEPVPIGLQTPTIYVPPSSAPYYPPTTVPYYPPSPALYYPPLTPPPQLSPSTPPQHPETVIPAAFQNCLAVMNQAFSDYNNQFTLEFRKIQDKLRESSLTLGRLTESLSKLPTTKTTAPSGPRYAPEDPTLPIPWKGLIDGSTGSLYYWNTESNKTQYERPCNQASQYQITLTGASVSPTIVLEQPEVNPASPIATTDHTAVPSGTTTGAALASGPELDHKLVEGNTVQSILKVPMDANIDANSDKAIDVVQLLQKIVDTTGEPPQLSVVTHVDINTSDSTTLHKFPPQPGGAFSMKLRSFATPTSGFKESVEPHPSSVVTTAVSLSPASLDSVMLSGTSSEANIDVGAVDKRNCVHLSMGVSTGKIESELHNIDNVVVVENGVVDAQAMLSRSDGSVVKLNTIEAFQEHSESDGILTDEVDPCPAFTIVQHRVMKDTVCQKKFSLASTRIIGYLFSCGFIYEAQLFAGDTQGQLQVNAELVLEKLWEKWKSGVHTELASECNARNLESLVTEGLNLSNDAMAMAIAMAMCSADRKSAAQLWQWLILCLCVPQKPLIILPGETIDELCNALSQVVPTLCLNFQDAGRACESKLSGSSIHALTDMMCEFIHACDFVVGCCTITSFLKCFLEHFHDEYCGSSANMAFDKDNICFLITVNSWGWLLDGIESSVTFLYMQIRKISSYWWMTLPFLGLSTPIHTSQVSIICAVEIGRLGIRVFPAGSGEFFFSSDVLVESLAIKGERAGRVQFYLEWHLPIISALMGGYESLSATPIYNKLVIVVCLWESWSAPTKSIYWSLMGIRTAEFKQKTTVTCWQPFITDFYNTLAALEPSLLIDSAVHDCNTCYMSVMYDSDKAIDFVHQVLSCQVNDFIFWKSNPCQSTTGDQRIFWSFDTATNCLLLLNAKPHFFNSGLRHDTFSHDSPSTLCLTPELSSRYSPGPLLSREHGVILMANMHKPFYNVVRYLTKDELFMATCFSTFYPPFHALMWTLFPLSPMSDVHLIQSVLAITMREKAHDINEIMVIISINVLVSLQQGPEIIYGDISTGNSCSLAVMFSSHLLHGLNSEALRVFSTWHNLFCGQSNSTSHVSVPICAVVHASQVTCACIVFPAALTVINHLTIWYSMTWGLLRFTCNIRLVPWLGLLRLDLHSGLHPIILKNEATAVGALSSSALLRTREIAKEIHDVSYKATIHSDSFVASALIGMYPKCGMSLTPPDKVVFTCFKQMTPQEMLPNKLSYATIFSCGKLATSFQERQIPTSLSCMKFLSAKLFQLEPYDGFSVEKMFELSVEHERDAMVLTSAVSLLSVDDLTDQLVDVLAFFCMFLTHPVLSKLLTSFAAHVCMVDAYMLTKARLERGEVSARVAGANFLIRTDARPEDMPYFKGGGMLGLLFYNDLLLGFGQLIYVGLYNYLVSGLGSGLPVNG